MEYKLIAEQLRKPEGELGRKVGENMNQGNRLINLAAIEHLQLAKDDEVLEIGMGNGYFCQHILSFDNSITYTGCDFSELMVEEATLLNAEWVQNGKAKFVFGVAHLLPFPDQVFDKVFTVNTLYFWEDPARVLAEVRRVLKKEGLLVVAFRPPEIMDALPFIDESFRRYSAREATDLLMKNGFDIHECHEIAEPDQEFKGLILKMASVIIRAVKSKTVD